MAADKGNAAAASHIGEMYGVGIGVPKNELEAAKWYRQAAIGGNAFAQNALGQLYENGRGVPQDYAEALKWYRLSAGQKFAAGQNNLGTLYSKGRGVPLDQAEASRLFRLSADQGNAFGQLNLGFQYVAGNGVPMSTEAAYFWLNLGVSRLPANVTALRDTIARARDAEAAKLAPAELQRLQQMAVAWTPGSAAVPSVAGGAGAPRPAGVSPAVGAGAARVTGTGFVVGVGGFVVTNNHVAGQCNEVHARHNADLLGTLTVIAKDAQNDLALLKLPTRYPDAAVFREDRGLRQGDNVVVYGFPLVGVLTPQGNLTTGSISALSGLGNDSRMLQVSAPVQPGNSGGPLLDAGGNVIGVVSSKLNALRTAAATGDIPQNVNFAIKGGVVRNFLDANGVEYRTTAETHELKTADVGDRAKKFTLYIECTR
jgi:S1-C subfamily serine protease